jgi:hypothetical protein
MAGEEVDGAYVDAVPHALGVLDSFSGREEV